MKAMKSIAAGAVLACLPLTSHALVNVGAAGWMYAPSGSMTAEGTAMDFDDQLGLESGISGFVWASIEPPMLPNLKLRYTPMTLSGEKTTALTVPGYDFTGDSALKSSVSLDQVDIIAYIKLPLPVPMLDVAIGGNLKLLTTGVEVKGEVTGGATETYTSPDGMLPVPMFYAHANFNLPLSGLSAHVEASTLGVVSDVIAGVRYRVLPLARVELGYRSFSIDFDVSDLGVDDLEFDTTVQGLYAGLTASF